jgi:hypothetical protein
MTCWRSRELSNGWAMRGKPGLGREWRGLAMRCKARFLDFRKEPFPRAADDGRIGKRL